MDVEGSMQWVDDYACGTEGDGVSDPLLDLEALLGGSSWGALSLPGDSPYADLLGSDEADGTCSSGVLPPSAGNTSSSGSPPHSGGAGLGSPRGPLSPSPAASGSGSGADARGGSNKEQAQSAGSLEVEAEARRRLRMARNRENAHLSRQRKKALLEGLEQRCAALQHSAAALGQLLARVGAENALLRQQLAAACHAAGATPPTLPPPVLPCLLAQTLGARFGGSSIGGSTGMPTGLPTGMPTGMPTGLPTGLPTGMPTGLSTGMPTGLPTGLPNGLPTNPPPVAGLSGFSAAAPATPPTSSHSQHFQTTGPSTSSALSAAAASLPGAHPAPPPAPPARRSKRARGAGAALAAFALVCCVGALAWGGMPAGRRQLQAAGVSKGAPWAAVPELSRRGRQLASAESHALVVSGSEGAGRSFEEAEQAGEDAFASASAPRCDPLEEEADAQLLRLVEELAPLALLLKQDWAQSAEALPRLAAPLLAGVSPEPLSVCRPLLELDVRHVADPSTKVRRAVERYLLNEVGLRGRATGGEGQVLDGGAEKRLLLASSEEVESLGSALVPAGDALLGGSGEGLAGAKSAVVGSLWLPDLGHNASAGLPGRPGGRQLVLMLQPRHRLTAYVCGGHCA